MPHLRSGTDTSYFPTDEIDQTEAEQPMAESGEDAKKDLAFLGYTWVPRVKDMIVILTRRFRRYEML